LFNHVCATLGSFSLEKEVVVGTNGLNLVVGVQQRPVVPETDVLDCELGVGDVCSGRHRLCRIVLFDDASKTECLPGGGDVVLDVRGLEFEFIRLNL